MIIGEGSTDASTCGGAFARADAAAAARRR